MWQRDFHKSLIANSSHCSALLDAKSRFGELGKECGILGTIGRRRPGDIYALSVLNLIYVVNGIYCLYATNGIRSFHETILAADSTAVGGPVALLA